MVYLFVSNAKNKKMPGIKTHRINYVQDIWPSLTQIDINLINLNEVELAKKTIVLITKLYLLPRLIKFDLLHALHRFYG
jgi:hypothetical protein